MGSALFHSVDTQNMDETLSESTWNSLEDLLFSPPPHPKRNNDMPRAICLFIFMDYLTP